MGVLLDTRRGQLIALGARSVIGRSAACTIAIDDPRASAEHAAIAWSGERWELRDLGSSNGTFLDGRRLAAGERAALVRDGRLGFGRADGWLMVDDAPAGPVARAVATGALAHASDGLLALPSATDPQATIFHAGNGWQIEIEPAARPIASGEVIEVGGARWELLLPRELGVLPATLPAEDVLPPLAETPVLFAPSLDEEHVEVRVRAGAAGEMVLASRSSNYLLLVLARTRLQDMANGLAADEQGWMYTSDLADMLRYSPDRLNVEIFRARTVFAKLGFADSPQLIERRPITRQLRIGLTQLRELRPERTA